MDLGGEVIEGAPSEAVALSRPVVVTDMLAVPLPLAIALGLTERAVP